MMIAGITTAVALVLQYQLNKYFADAMDITLLRNIAGGNIKNALLYVLDEAFLLVLGVLFLCAFYFLAYKIAKKYLIVSDDNNEKNIVNYTTKNIVKYSFIALFLTAVSILFINENENLRYYLNRSNSYYVITTAFNTLSDFDRDGYGSFKFPQDNSILNSSIYPGALDIPNNGIDEDGFFGDFVDFKPFEQPNINLNTTEKPKHIIVIMMESTRADVIGKTIDGRLVAPNITTLANEGLVIDEAFSHTGYTGSSITSFFSGRIGDFDKKESLFPILKNYGYQTAIFSGQDETWDDIDIRLGTREFVDYLFDAQVGVDERVFPSKLPSSIKLSEETLWNKFKIYSDNLDWNTPQLLYFNMQAAHFPYYHERMTKNFVEEGIPRSQINIENSEWLQMTYWNALNHADLYIGNIIAELKSKGQWEDSLVIISGDHGEELFDNNHLGHGFFLSKVQTHIPLVINQKDFEFNEPVGHSDMKELILSYAFNNPILTSENTYEKTVFQLIGGLNNPNKIALRYPNHQQITIDMRNMLIRPIGEEAWIPYSDAIKSPEIREEAKKLILYWENLRWQSHLNT